jgi:hypothetical protein
LNGYRFCYLFAMTFRRDLRWDQGSMLWSHFLVISPFFFCEKIVENFGTNVMIIFDLFLENLKIITLMSDFCNFFRRKYLKFLDICPDQNFLLF